MTTCSKLKTIARKVVNRISAYHQISIDIEVCGHIVASSSLTFMLYWNISRRTTSSFLLLMAYMSIYERACEPSLDPVSGSSTPSSSRMSSVTPASPLSPQTLLSPSTSSPFSLLPVSSPPVSRKSSFSVPPIHTPFTPSLPVDPADPLIDSSEIVMSQEPEFDFSVHPSFFPLHQNLLVRMKMTGFQTLQNLLVTGHPAQPTAQRIQHWDGPCMICCHSGGEKRKSDKVRQVEVPSSIRFAFKKMYRCPVRLVLYSHGSTLIISFFDFRKMDVLK